MYKNTLLVIVSLTISLVCTEVVLQFTTHNPNYYFSNRYLFVTPNYARNVTDNLWTYTPNQMIKETVVYGFSEIDFLPGDEFEIEYQCSFNTNNLGLIQDRNFEKGDDATVILGDSFTTGHGGCPWFPRFSSRFPQKNLLNGGLMGTGVTHWHHLVKYIKSHGVTVTRIVIIAITNDFKRDPGYGPRNN